MIVEQKGKVGILRMQEGKANSMSAAFLSSLDGALDELSQLPINSIILTGYENHFSTGLNLVELWNYDRAQFGDFLRQFSKTFMRFLRLPQVVISAVNGNAIAGGAVLIQFTEYRIMARTDARIGVNEINVGLPFPHQVMDIVRIRLPRSSRFDAIYRGLLYTADEALKVGLIDEVTEPSALMDRAMELAEELASKNHAALACIKRDLWAPDLERLDMLGRLGDDDFIDVWFSEETRAVIGAIIESFKSKKKA